MAIPKIRLMQLPLQEAYEGRVSENIPLAAGYLLCALKEAGMDRLVDARIVPQEMMDVGGDAQIIDAVVAEQPDLLGFSCYCWNVERSLFLAEKIKERFPHILILLGGPEIVEGDTIALNSPAYDIAVIGEGEKPFVEIVRVLLQGVRDFTGIPQLWIKGHGSPCSPSTSVGEDALPKLSPYLEGYLTPSAGGTVYVEAVRGCQFSCSYCYYPKNFFGVRCFPLTLLRDIFVYARKVGASEVCFLDPSFNTNPNFRKTCRLLAEVNRGKTLAVHAELRADFLTQEDVDLLIEANLRTAELGLQTIHSETGKTLRRPCNLDRWIKGMEMLRERGVNVRCDMILGLPGEGLDKMRKNIDFLSQHGCEDEAQIFHLNLLPGTDLRKDSTRYGIRYQKTPPYMVVETTAASHVDLAEALSYAQEILGIEISPLEGGPFLFPGSNKKEIFCGENILSDPIRLQESIHRYRRNVFNQLRIWFNAYDLNIYEDAVVGLVSGIHRDNPYTLLEIILEASLPFSTDLIKRVLEYGTFFSHYINKSHYYIDRTGLRSTRMAALFPLEIRMDPSLSILSGDIGIYFRIPPDLPAIGPEIREMAEGFFVDVSDREINWKKLSQNYQNLPLFFRSPAHYKKWRNLMEIEVDNFPGT